MTPSKVVLLVLGLVSAVCATLPLLPRPLRLLRNKLHRVGSKYVGAQEEHYHHFYPLNHPANPYVHNGIYAGQFGHGLPIVPSYSGIPAYSAIPELSVPFAPYQAYPQQPTGLGLVSQKLHALSSHQAYPQQPTGLGLVSQKLHALSSHQVYPQQPTGLGLVSQKLHALSSHQAYPQQHTGPGLVSQKLHALSSHLGAKTAPENLWNVPYPPLSFGTHL